MFANIAAVAIVIASIFIYWKIWFISNIKSSGFHCCEANTPLKLARDSKSKSRWFDIWDESNCIAVIVFFLSSSIIFFASVMTVPVLEHLQVHFICKHKYLINSCELFLKRAHKNFHWIFFYKNVPATFAKFSIWKWISNYFIFYSTSCCVKSSDYKTNKMFEWLHLKKKMFQI